MNEQNYLLRESWCWLLCNDADSEYPEISGDMLQLPRVTSRSPSPQGDQVQGHGVQAGGQRALVCGVVYLSQDTLHATAFSGVDMTI